ncbi:MAG: very short patch repair endonuclease [Candidatus Azambacteria bacterium]|nr:very short patch repair endonuclease [Candidatus Azambacteria bacterium]
MAAVHSSGNATTELALIKLFKKAGIKGWRRHKKISGIHPDFVFTKKRIAVFVHGCFWHGCRWHGDIPVSNRKFWNNKINGNKKRDLYITRKLMDISWKGLRIWEHEIKINPGNVIMKTKKSLSH